MMFGQDREGLDVALEAIPFGYELEPFGDEPEEDDERPPGSAPDRRLLAGAGRALIERAVAVSLRSRRPGKATPGRGPGLWDRELDG